VLLGKKLTGRERSTGPNLTSLSEKSGLPRKEGKREGLPLPTEEKDDPATGAKLETNRSGQEKKVWDPEGEEES